MCSSLSPWQAHQRGTTPSVAPVVVKAPGSYFGELPMVLRWNAMGSTAVARSRVLIATVPRSDLTAILGSLPELEAALMLDAKKRLLEMLRATKCPFFAEMADDEPSLTLGQRLMIALVPASVPALVIIIALGIAVGIGVGLTCVMLISTVLVAMLTRAVQHDAELCVGVGCEESGVWWWWRLGGGSD